MLLIIILNQDHIILTHSSTEFLAGATHTHGIGLQTRDRFLAGYRVGMYADKHVGLIPVGNSGTLMQRDKHIRLTCIDDLHVRTVLLHITSKSQCHLQIDVLLIRVFSRSTCILTSVAGINHQRKWTFRRK